MAFIGKRNLLPVVRESESGLHLDGGELGEILLPGRYIPREWTAGEPIDAFIYRDSDDRLVATTEMPFAMVDEIACLRVVSVNRQVGAFLDWGLAKDLLLPFREQAGPVRVGQVVPVFVHLDAQSDRIVASARLENYLSEDTPVYQDGQPVKCLVIGRTPLGYKAVVAGSHLGLFYEDALPGPLQIGERIHAFVRMVRPDGKIDLSLDASGYQRVAGITERIVQALERNGGSLEFDDDSSPEEIRRAFGVSKKAFKQALGKLLKQRRIRFCQPGIQLLDATTWSPGGEVTS
jgi:uncharacterized protein